MALVDVRNVMTPLEKAEISNWLAFASAGSARLCDAPSPQGLEWSPKGGLAVESILKVLAEFQYGSLALLLGVVFLVLAVLGIVPLSLGRSPQPDVGPRYVKLKQTMRLICAVVGLGLIAISYFATSWIKGRHVLPVTDLVVLEQDGRVELIDHGKSIYIEAPNITVNRDYDDRSHVVDLKLSGEWASDAPVTFQLTYENRGKKVEFDHRDYWVEFSHMGEIVFPPGSDPKKKDIAFLSIKRID
jgi:hypothetical protein